MALGLLLGVSRKTAMRYGAEAETDGKLRHLEDGPRKSYRYFAGDESEAEVLEQVTA